jgi:hypothetical protein
MTSQKRDAGEFREHIGWLQNQYQSHPHPHWLQFLYHFTDVRNAASILSRSELLSRRELLRRGLPFVDAAHPGVIDHTPSNRQDLVRLYFRPQTPTLYLNEGIRPLSLRPASGTHCPIPVFLLFDVAPILCQVNCQFSSGNLGRGETKLFSTANEFRSLPFQDIYHVGAFSNAEKARIINHRHAEVVIPKALSLENLRRVMCRSAAERDTLQHLLGSDWIKWRDIIRVDADLNLFHRRWNYIESAALSTQLIHFRIHEAVDFDARGPFELRIEINDAQTSQTSTVEQTITRFLNIPSLDISQLKTAEYTITVYADDSLIYSSSYHDFNSEIPF